MCIHQENKVVLSGKLMYNEMYSLICFHIQMSVWHVFFSSPLGAPSMYMDIGASTRATYRQPIGCHIPKENVYPLPPISHD